jgi:hypothetical protein
MPIKIAILILSNKFVSPTTSIYFNVIGHRSFISGNMSAITLAQA